MTYKEYKFCLKADRIIAGRPVRTFTLRLKLLFSPQPLERFMLLLRKVEYLDTQKGLFNKISLMIARRRFYRVSLKLGFSIEPHVFGPGLYIPHYGTIVVNGNSKVGANCVLHTCVCIGDSRAKNIGDNVYISTGTTIIGNISIADNITISANSFVNKSLPEGNSLVGGTPAAVIKPKKAWFDCEGHEQYAIAVKQIEALRNEMFPGDDGETAGSHVKPQGYTLKNWVKVHH